MNKLFSLFCAATIMAFCACGNENDFPTVGETSVDLQTIDTIKVNETPLKNEAEVVPGLDDENYKNFVKYFLYDDETKQWEEGVRTLKITFSNDKVTYVFYNKKGNQKTLSAEDAEVTAVGAHLTVKAHKKFKYVLQGVTTDGGLKLYGDKKSIIELNGVTITNPTGAAINIQKGVDGGKRCFIEVKEGTRNSLTDGATYTEVADEDQKGVVFSEDKICIGGDGYLCITGKGKHGIASDDYVYLHKGTQLTITPAAGYDGIKTKDGIFVAGGVQNIVCSGNAARGLNSSGIIKVTGGRTTVINTSVAVMNSEDNDISHPYCVKTDSCLTMTDGTLLLSATKRGGCGIKATKALTIEGGMVNMYVYKTAMISDATAPAKGKVYVNGKEQK